MKYNYVPDDKNSYSVSKTLEYAYDDWCISQIAKKSGNDSLDKVFSKRAANYQRVFNTENGFMQPKLANGNFRRNFDPLDTHGQGFIEGNAYNYGLYVPHEPEKLIQMMGGKNKFEGFLDTLFSGHLDDKHIEKNEDITREGIMGLYVHGNEPGHHIPYLYNFTQSPFKTQERVREIMQQMYSNANNGLCGNDDCGQMSAWYVFSALGFYPLCPGSTEYLIGSPLVKKAKINLAKGNTLIISTLNQGRNKLYVDKIFFNGKEIKDYRINHYQLLKGGELVFQMK
jgi:predicted alpha-1,2-mannosidase